MKKVRVSSPYSTKRKIIKLGKEWAIKYAKKNNMASTKYTMTPVITEVDSDER
jgi:hypothetical protein